MSIRIATIASLLCVVSTGCGGSSEPFKGVEDFDAQIALADCKRDVLCGNIGATEEAACKTSFTESAMKYRPPYAPADALKQKRLKLDQKVASACLAAHQAAPCTIDGFFDVLFKCDGTFIPLVAPGGACQADVECIDGYCDQGTADSDGCPGTCVANLATGATCDPNDNHCGPHDFCDGASKVCTARGIAGAACGRCDVSLYCRGSDPHTGMGGTCGPAGKVGETCQIFFFGNTDCDPSLYCSSMTQKCSARIAQGQVCDGYYACVDGFLCTGLVLSMNDGSVMQKGQCAPPLDVGATCDPAFSESGCPLSTACDPSTKKCTARPGAGADCSQAFCTSGLYCDGTTLTCAPLVPLGGACTPPPDQNSDDPCHDGSCDPSAGVCTLICM